MKWVIAISIILNLILLGRCCRKEMAVQAAEGEARTPAGNGDVNADGTIDLSDGIYILSWLFTGGAAPVPAECAPLPGSLLPATGQTTCTAFVDGEGWVTVPCDDPRAVGQDAWYGAGCPPEDRYVDHGDGTVTDTCTGLMWQKDTADLDGDGSITPEDRANRTGAHEYSEGLEFAGHADWRLPNIRELQSLVDFGRRDPAIDPVFDAVSGIYCTSSTRVRRPQTPWDVNFGDGRIAEYLVFGDPFGLAIFYVRAVRRAQ